jgi:hypothetical protein
MPKVGATDLFETPHQSSGSEQRERVRLALRT